MISKKTKSVISAIVICMVFAIIYMLYKQPNNNYTTNCDRLSNDEIAMLQDGDIIIRKGFGYVSNKIADILNEPYNVSHCGVIYRPTPIAMPVVIHSVSSTLSDIDGVQRCNIQKFAHESEANSIIVVRYKDTAQHSAKIIATEAQRLLLRNLPFDNSFDLTDSSKIYCTELVWKILNDKFGHDLYPNKSSLSTMGFAPLTDTAYFDIVISHNNAVK